MATRVLSPLLVLLVTAGACDGCGDDTPPPLTVWAAASLTDVLPAIAQAWREDGGAEVVFSFDGSSRLARQIEAGAPADAFFSADERWMDYLVDRARVVESTRTPLARNTLVAVVPADADDVPDGPGALAGPRFRRIAVATEEAPAGRYAAQALSGSGIPGAVDERLVRGGNVRTALAWVASGEADAGIVYRTDALAEPRVREAFAFDAATHDPIVYPAAVIRHARNAELARELLRYCRGERARAILRDAGFEAP